VDSGASYTFPKSERLKSRKQIDLLFSEGKSFFAAPVKCYYVVRKLENSEYGKEEEIRNTKYEILSEDINLNPLPARPGEAIRTGEAGGINEKPEDTLSGRGGFIHGEDTQTPNPKPQTQTTINHKQQTTNIKAGFSVSKRQFKKAADRNRVKRLMREAYRLHKQKLTTQAAGKQVRLEVFFVFTDRTLPAFALVEEKMKYCLRRLGKIMEDNV